jgi:hypothetical protein
MFLSLSTLAQQPSAAEINRLRDQIRELEKVACDPSLTPVAREMNRKYLARRRNQLNTLLSQEIAGLRGYESRLGFLLTFAKDRNRREPPLRDQSRNSR